MKTHNLFPHFIIPFIFIVALSGDVQSTGLPESMEYSEDMTMLRQGGIASTGFYDETILRTINLTFSQADFWQLLENNYSTEIDIPADLTIDGTLYPGVGVRFKGSTSYRQAQDSEKKSFNIHIDYTDSTSKLMGYKTLNLNNCFNDPSFIREVLYFNHCRKYTACPKGNFVKLTINGENWGIYANIQQLNSDFIEEWFLSSDGDRWQAEMDMIIQPGRVPGGQPGTGGDRALTWLGDDQSVYMGEYELKSSHTDDPWGNLIRTCNVLNNLPLTEYADSLEAVLAVDRCLWFLAVENIFGDEDGYLGKGADYQIYNEAETGRIHPLEFDGNETFLSKYTYTDPFDGEDNSSRPLISKLLAVPEYRQRYLAHIRTILTESFDWSVLGPQIDNYRALIGEEVLADTKKLYTNTDYNASVTDLQTFVNSRRNYLLNNTEINRTAPSVTNVTRTAGQSKTTLESSSSPIWVTAEITCPSGISSVILYYADGLIGPFTRTSMFDDGLHEDGSAGDGIYGGEIPSISDCYMVRYYIEARAADTWNTAVFSPAGAEHDVYVYRESLPTATSSLRINEIMASNSSVISDPQGDYDDWIELVNTGSQDIDLSGMYLSDNEYNLLKWSFPSETILPAGSYLLVWADEDGKDTPGLHANFKLSASGEAVFLSDTDERGNVLLDTIMFGLQTTDVSYGRYPDKTGDFIEMVSTTPGSANTNPTIVEQVVQEYFTLQHNYPNPFNPVTTISYLLPSISRVTLSVYNATGQQIRSFDLGLQEAGHQTFLFDGAGLPSGAYFYRIDNGMESRFGRMTLIK